MELSDTRPNKEVGSYVVNKEERQDVDVHHGK